MAIKWRNRDETKNYTAPCIFRRFLCIPNVFVCRFFRRQHKSSFSSLAIICAIAIIAAFITTRKLLEPIEGLAENIENGAMDGHDAIYRELAPLIAQIRSQKASISAQLKEIEGEQHKFSSIIQYMNEGLIVLDSHKMVLVVNESAIKFLGLTITHQNMALVEICRDINLNEAVRAAIAGNNSTVSLEKNGRTLEIFVSPVFEDNAISGAICMILDVTEKAQLENIKQEFTANVSHELKTPLTTILGYAEMMETGMAKPADMPNFSATIHREASRMMTLISDILRLSELDEGGLEMKKAPVNLMEIAKDCAKSLAPIAKKQNISFNISAEECNVQGDEKMLYELVYNLCDNAIRYNKPNGTVSISAHGTEFCVADTGIGVPENCQARIFERFFRVDKSRSKETGGTGLGLAIVKHIALCHNASISLTSHENQGTAITVKF